MTRFVLTADVEVEADDEPRARELMRLLADRVRGRKDEPYVWGRMFSLRPGGLALCVCGRPLPPDASQCEWCDQVGSDARDDVLVAGDEDDEA